MSHKILFTGGTLSSTDIEKIKNLGFELTIERADLSETELIKALEGKEVYILGGAEKATARVLESSKDLKVLAFLGVGYQSFVDVEAATNCGIAVTNTPGANAQSVAEFTIALIIDAVKRLTYLIESTKMGNWQEYRTWNLQKRNLGIVGLGTIGERVARIAKNGFGMNILYHSRNRKLQIETELDARYLSLSELIEQSDVLSIHAAYSPETVGMIGEKELEKMKRSAVLVNAARAELVEPFALKKALEERWIAVAAMDGYYVEPVPSPDQDKFGLVKLSSEKILITPHTAYLTEDSMEAMLNMNLSSIVNLLSGNADPLIVNPTYKFNTR